jgi:hypothetical protein
MKNVAKPVGNEIGVLLGEGKVKLPDVTIGNFDGRVMNIVK